MPIFSKIIAMIKAIIRRMHIKYVEVVDRLIEVKFNDISA